MMNDIKSILSTYRSALLFTTAILAITSDAYAFQNAAATRQPGSLYALYQSGASAGQADPLHPQAAPTPPKRGVQQQSDDTQSQVGKPDAAAPPAQQASPEPGQRVENDTIVVTGTLIRGVGISAGTKPIVVQGSDIINYGYATLQQALTTLPQVSPGGINENVNFGNRFATTNITSASSPDLRGLGPKATLILVNGRRIPTTNINTISVDISSLPLAAVERIEVLPDGASSLYGSDAVAGVINIILKKKYQGADTTLRYGMTSDGEAEEFLASQTFGHEWQTGSVIAAFEYYRRDNLHHSERDYSRSDDFRRYGGTDLRSIYTSPGNVANPRTFVPEFGIPAGQDGRLLTPEQILAGDQTYKGDLILGNDLLPKQNRHGLYVNVRQELGGRTELFAEGRYGRRKTRRLIGYAFSAVAVPSTHPLFVDVYGDDRPYVIFYNFANDLPPSQYRARITSYVGTAGADYTLSEDIFLRAHVSYSQEKSRTDSLNRVNAARLREAMSYADPAVVFNPYGDGGDNNPDTLRFITPSTSTRTNAKIVELTGIADGTLFEIPYGEIKFAAGGSFRAERIDNHYTTANAKFHRDVYAAFGELFVPVVTEMHNVPWVHGLELSASLRYEKYYDNAISPVRLPETTASSTTPKVGAKWDVTPELTVRGTIGRSFAMPSLNLRTAETYLSALTMPDPRTPGRNASVLILTGTDPSLTHEKAKTWSLGATLTPSQNPLIRLSANYFSIKFRNQISDLPISTDMLSRLNELQDLIVLDPSEPLILGACRLGSDPELLPPNCQFPELTDAFIDARTKNQATALINGVDLQATIDFEISDKDRIAVSADATYLSDNKFKLTDNGPYSHRVNTVANPMDFRSRLTVSWSRDQVFNAFAALNYQDDYKGPIINARPQHIESWTTVDVSFMYRISSSNSLAFIGDLSLTISCTNIFDRDPPFVNNFGGFDGSNASPLGRFIAANIKKTW